MTEPELRPMEAELDGYAWIPRMIDKARASRAGTIGDYLYPCPIDQSCLRRLGLGAETFADVASARVDDAGVLAELRRRGIPTASQAWFDPVALEHELCA